MGAGDIHTLKGGVMAMALSVEIFDTSSEPYLRIAGGNSRYRGRGKCVGAIELEREIRIGDQRHGEIFWNECRGDRRPGPAAGDDQPIYAGAHLGRRADACVAKLDDSPEITNSQRSHVDSRDSNPWSVGWIGLSFFGAHNFLELQRRQKAKAYGPAESKPDGDYFLVGKPSADGDGQQQCAADNRQPEVRPFHDLAPHRTLRLMFAGILARPGIGVMLGFLAGLKYRRP